MDGVVAGCADYESLASFSGHEFRPCWSWLPWLAEVSGLADVVDVYLAGALAHLTPFCAESCDQLLAVGGPGWFVVGDDRVPLPFSGRPPNVAINGFLPARSTRAWKHLRSPCGVWVVAW